jgi:hypothetical protein
MVRGQFPGLTMLRVLAAHKLESAVPSLLLPMPPFMLLPVLLPSAMHARAWSALCRARLLLHETPSRVEIINIRAMQGQ